MHRQVSVAETGVSLAKARTGQVGVQQSEVQASRHLAGQAQADVAAAAAGREQIEMKRTQVETARAQAQQAQASLAAAKIAEMHTYIYAPADGVVVKKEANPGAALSP